MMNTKILAAAGLLGAAALGLAAPVQAGGFQEGSLLTYPFFDNQTDSGGQTNTLITVVNTSSDHAIDVEFVYINGANCQETNRTRHLTARDTLSVITRVDNPNMQQGFVYLFAKDGTNGPPVKFD